MAVVFSHFQTLSSQQALLQLLVIVTAGIEISTHPLTHPSLKASWVSANCEFFVAFLKVTRPIVSAVNIKFPTLVTGYRYIPITNDSPVN